MGRTLSDRELYTLEGLPYNVGQPIAGLGNAKHPNFALQAQRGDMTVPWFQTHAIWLYASGN